MSRVLQTKNKDLVNLQVKRAKDVWVKNKKGEFELDKKFKYFGKVDKGQSAFVSLTNMKGKNPKFVEDTHKLPKKTKNDIVKEFSNKKTSIVYLVKKK